MSRSSFAPVSSPEPLADNAGRLRSAVPLLATVGLPLLAIASVDASTTVEAADGLYNSLSKSLDTHALQEDRRESKSHTPRTREHALREQGYILLTALSSSLHHTHRRIS